MGVPNNAASLVPKIDTAGAPWFAKASVWYVCRYVQLQIADE